MSCCLLWIMSQTPSPSFSFRMKWLTSLLFHHRGRERQTEKQRGRKCERQKKQQEKNRERHRWILPTQYMARECNCEIVSHKCITFLWLDHVKRDKWRVRGTWWVSWVISASSIFLFNSGALIPYFLYTNHGKWVIWHRYIVLLGWLMMSTYSAIHQCSWIRKKHQTEWKWHCFTVLSSPLIMQKLK